MIDLADAQARQDTLDCKESFHVEAPAGSGKTLLLTTRFIKLLGQVDHPAEILALTFTEKAAQEMRTRIIDTLQRAKEPAGQSFPPVTPAEGELHAAAEEALRRHQDCHNLLASSNSLNIMTFHGFCYYLASRAPLEAGVNPDFIIADDTMQPGLAAESTARSMERLIALPAGDVRRKALENRALYHDNNWRALTNELVDVIRKRDHFADLVSMIREAGGSDLSLFLETLEKRVRFYVERRLAEMAGHVARTPLGRRWKDFMHHLTAEGAEAALILPAALPGTLWEDLPIWNTMADILLTQAGTPRKTMGPKTGFFKGFLKSDWGLLITDMPPHVARMLHETRDLPRPDDPPADMKVLSDLIILCSEIISDYDRFCRTRSMTDFIGLENCALRVLDTAAPSDLSLFLDHRLRHILIDEFQDTNRVQWELLQRLVSGWERGDGRTIFIVGDPKQSIYGFRNAEVNLFFEAKDGIPQPGSGSVALLSRLLETNFRSDADLIEWVNSIFGATIMARHNEEVDEVPYSPSIAADTAGSGHCPGSVSLALFTGRDSATARDNEAMWLAETARKLIDETGGSQTVGILLFTRTHLMTYLRAFNNAGVPLQVQEGLLLVDRPEVQHLLQATRFLVRPQDDLAGASLLRSPWSWCDVSLLAEAALSPELPWIDKLRFTAGNRPEMDMLIRALDRGLTRIGRDPLGTVMKTFWQDLEGPGRTAALYGMPAVANCIRFCEILNELDDETPQETLERLESLMETFYEPADPTATRSPAQMMTIHRAKGLEFDAVMLPFMDWNPLSTGSAGPPPYLVERLPGRKEEHLIATGKDSRIPGHHRLFRLLSRLGNDRKKGEAKRLFYVAATRARSRLLMSGITGLSSDGIRPPRKSPLSWIWSHYNGLDGLLNRKSGESVSEDIRLAVEINPAPPAGPERTEALDMVRIPLPLPYEISPEPSILSVRNPSSRLTEIDSPVTPGTALPEIEEDRSIETIRGTIIHRLLKTGIDKGTLPASGSVLTALRRAGISFDKAQSLVPGILREASDTLESPFIAGLIKTAAGTIHTEWKLEQRLSPTSLISGAIDLAVFDGSSWWIVDFKTGTPDKDDDKDLFVPKEAKRHGPQIEAYRQLLAQRIHPESNPIRAGIFFTALQNWSEIESPP